MDFKDKRRSFAFLGGQSAPPATDGIGVRALYQCRICRRVWLQDGKSAILDVPSEVVQALAQELSADLEQLPSSTCRICLWRAGGASVSIDEYDQGEGFGFCWEILKPSIIQATSAILSQKAASKPESRPDVLTQREKLHAVIRAVKNAHTPRDILVLPPALCHLQTTTLRPGLGQPGTASWRWQGWCYTLPCLPLAGEATVTLMFALPRTERMLSVSAFSSWQMLLELVDAVLKQ